MRISREQALDYLNSEDLIGIGMEADAVRRRMHPEGAVTYTLDAAEVAHAAVFLVTDDDTSEDRAARLEAIYKQQTDTGQFTEVVFDVGRSVTAVEYLKVLAVSRVYLDNVDNIQADLETQGLKVLQMALRFGANDVGMVPGSETTEEDIRRVIRGAGFTPVIRDYQYRTVSLY